MTVSLVVDVRQQIRELAYDMVRLDGAIADARKVHDWVRVGDLETVRLDVQLLRSLLMFDCWSPRPRRRSWE